MSEINTHNSPSKTLDDLFAVAERYVDSTMRQSGTVGPVVMMLCENGSLLLLPGDSADDQAKERFVRVARLACIAYAATAVVFVAEAWMSRDASQRPSQAADRQRS